MRCSFPHVAPPRLGLMNEELLLNPGEQSGGYQCSDIRFAVPTLPLAIYLCHCKGCRKQSSSAFGISFELPTAH
jgi:hypothetical protein